jgi:curli biogenesis system outer membrane secretion channel CsgG
MVGKMQCKAANCNNGNNGGAGASGLAALLQMANAANGGLSNVSGIADGIKDVLVTALSESGCFEVQDREQLDEIAKELELAGKKVQTQQAEFLISGAVTQIDVSTENKSFGAGLLPFVGSIGTKTQKAAVALDMKLVRVETAKVVASKRATASTEDSSFSVGGWRRCRGRHHRRLRRLLSSLKGTNLEAVTKDAIVQSVNFLVDAARGARTASVAGAQPTP